MSARDDLYLFAMTGKVQEDGNRDMAVRKLDLYRSEVLSEAADVLAALLGQEPEQVRRIALSQARNRLIAKAKGEAS